MGRHLRRRSHYSEAQCRAALELNHRGIEIDGLPTPCVGFIAVQVGDHLGSSPNTVHHQAKSIYRKLNVHNRMELAHKAAAAGLLDAHT